MIIYKGFLRSVFRSEILFFKVFSNVKVSFSDPNFRSEICKFLSRSEIKNFRSDNQLM